MLNETQRTVVQMTVNVLAYVMNVDGDAMKPEERARLMTFLGKFVSQGKLNSTEVKSMVAEAHKVIAVTPFRDFCKQLTQLDLYPGQKLAIYMNAVDACYVDDQVSSGQTEQMEHLHRALGLQPETARAIQRLFLLKNSSAVLGDILHPSNAAGNAIRISLSSDT